MSYVRLSWLCSSASDWTPLNICIVSSWTNYPRVCRTPTLLDLTQSNVHFYWVWPGPTQTKP